MWTIKLDDPRPDLSDYNEVEANIDNDMMQEFVLQANTEEISKRTGRHLRISKQLRSKLCNTGKKTTIYECMFMVMKRVVDFPLVSRYSSLLRGEGDTMTDTSYLSVPSPWVVQPYNVKAICTDDSEGKEFIEYNSSRRSCHQPRVSWIL
jgi:hypothetical protein